MSLLSGGTTGPGQADEGLESYAEGGAPSAPASVPAPPSGAKRSASEVFSGLRVSLMPSDLEGQAGPDLGKRLLILALVLIVETLVIGGAYYFLTQKAGSQVQRRADLQAQIDGIEKQITDAEKLAKEAVAWNAQKAAAKEALDDRIYWTAFFKYVETKTLPTVNYLNFSGDADSGTVTLDATGTSYRDVAEQIVIFRTDPLVNDVHTTAASARVDQLGNVTGVSFTMVIRFKPELWRTKPAAVPEIAPTTEAGASAAQPSSPVVGDVTDCGTTPVASYSFTPADRQIALALGAAEDRKAVDCFDERLKACAAAKLVAGLDNDNELAFAVTGPVTGSCAVQVTAGPKLFQGDHVGETMTCDFDPEAGIEKGFSSTAPSLFSQCTGPLKDTFAAQEQK